MENIEKELSQYLPNFNISTAIKKDIFLPDDKDAELLVRARFISENLSPTIEKNLIEIEKKLLKESKTASGVLYNGFMYQKVLWDKIKKNKEGTINSAPLYIIITNRLLATPETEGDIPHIRVIILGQPAVISTSGIISGPAKSREYFRGEEDTKCICDINDKRIPDIITGYILQAVFYYYLGEAFCNNSKCRLFNAHWQKEMIYCQIENPTLCDRHASLLKKVISLSTQHFK